MDLDIEIRKKAFDPFRFNIVVNQYAISGPLTIQKGCNSLTFTNLGDTLVRVGQITLFPSAAPATIAGDSITIGGNLGEVFKGNIDISFAVPAGATPLLEVIQKFYLAYQ